MIAGLICLVAGSAIGGLARYVVSGLVARRFGEAFPWGTLLINVTGAFLIGILGARGTHDASMLAQPAPWLFAVTGFLGCYTTVSSFSLQTLILAHDGKIRWFQFHRPLAFGAGRSCHTAAQLHARPSSAAQWFSWRSASVGDWADVRTMRACWETCIIHRPLLLGPGVDAPR